MLAALLLTQCSTDPPYLVPPQRFDHGYSGTLQVEIESSESIKFECGERAIACSMHFPGTCIVYLPEQSRLKREDILRHETAHCNGWPANHPA